MFAQVFPESQQYFHQCFKKVRIRRGNGKNHGDKSIQEKLSAQTALKIRLLNDEHKETEEHTKAILKEIENNLIDETANKNIKIVKDHLKQIETEEGTFVHLGYWKLKQNCMIYIFPKRSFGRQDKSILKIQKQFVGT